MDEKKMSRFRKQAEEILQGKEMGLENYSVQDIQQLVHELQVRQIELEIQNDELFRAQLEVEAVRDRYTDLYDSAPVGYLAVSNTGIIQESNLTSASILDIARDKLLWQPFSAFVASDDRAAYYLYFKQLLNAEEAQQCEIRMVKKDSSHLWVSVEGVSVKDSEGNVTECRMIVSDISRRKQSETEQQRLTHELQERNKELNCLYGLSRLVEQQDISIDEILQGTVDLIPSSWQYSTITCANITLGEKICGASDCPVNVPGRLVSDIMVYGEKAGAINICYLESRPVADEGPFLKEERALINTIAERLGGIIEHNRAQETLRFQAQLLDVAGQSIIATDLEGKITYWNHFSETLYGWSSQEVLGRNILEITPSDTSKEQATEIMARLTEGEPWSGEFTVQRKDGTVFPALVVDSPVHDQDGNLTGIIGVSTDITERKQAEKRLHQYKNIVKNMDDGVSLVNQDGIYEIITNNYMTFLGKSRDEIEGHLVSEVLGEKTFREKVKPYFDRCMVGEVVRFSERFNSSTMGEFYIDVTYSPYQNKQGEIVGVIANSHNITELKQAEEALRESETFLNATGRIAKVGGWQIDVATQKLSWTDETYHIHEKPLDYRPTIAEALQFYPPESLATLEKALQSTMEDGYPFDLELDFITATGKPLYVRAICNPQMVDRKVDKLIGVFQDITERKQVEQKQMELTLEKERMQILSEFITQASHEFRTPLSVINTNTYFLGKLSGSEQQQTRVRRIEQQVVSLTALVEAMTIMSKLGGIQTLPVAEFNLCELIESIAENRKMEFASKHINSQLDLNIQSPVVKGDADYLRKAIEYLIDNAIRFTPENGSIIVHVGRKDEQIIIEVTDTGMGIDSEILPYIFDRFYRADQTGKTRGFGLGLPITKRIVELHQGCIKVESEVGKGSTFRILLPGSAGV